MPDSTAADRDAPAYPLRPSPAKQRVDYWRDRGAADAMVRLMMTGLLRPSVAFAEVCRAAGIPDSAARDAVSRFKNRARPPVKRANAPHAAPTGTKWCGYGGHFLPLAEFATNRTSSTGYQSWCRGCKVLARREQRSRKAA